MFPRFPVAILGALTVIACSDSAGPSAISIAQLTGTWELSRLDMVRASDNTVLQDMKSYWGLTASLSITRSGATTLVARMPGQSVTTVSGMLTLHGDTLEYVADNGSSYQATVKLAGRAMTWLSLETSPWDPDGDGVSEEARERDVWQRS